MRTAEFGLVDVLAAGAAGAHRVDADVFGADVEVDVLHLRQHRNRGRRGVDAPARLGGGYALHAMHARLVFEAGEHALARDGGDDLLVAAEVVLRQADDLGLPAVLLGVAAVHAEQIGGEQGGLVAAGAGAHLEDGALFVGRVLGQKVHAQLLLQLAPAAIDLAELVLRQVPEVLVGRGGSSVSCDQLAAARPSGLAQLPDGFDDRTEIGEFLRELRIGGWIDAAG